jgi:hypothetical protein
MHNLCHREGDLLGVGLRAICNGYSEQSYQPQRQTDHVKVRWKLRAIRNEANQTEKEQRSEARLARSNGCELLLSIFSAGRELTPFLLFAHQSAFVRGLAEEVFAHGRADIGRPQDPAILQLGHDHAPELFEHSWRNVAL